MDTITIIHNPRCSKSRQALQIIESHGYQARIIDYLHGELSKEFLKEVINKLGIHPKAILRTQEEEFKDLNIDLENENEVIDAIIKCPKLLERPIIVKDEKAVIGRPPENVLSLLKS